MGRYSRWRIWLWRISNKLFRPPYPDIVNHPDLPRVAKGWVILDTDKYFGTFAATFLGGDQVLLGVFKGYDQLGGGIVITREQTERVLAMFPPVTE